MYLDFYGLRELPFELTPNPRFLFMTSQHREALSTLQFGLSAGKPLTVLLGEAGTGKTTLLRAALESESCSHVRSIKINNPALRRDEFVELLATDFDLSPGAGRSKTMMLHELQSVLTDARARGESFALVVDEAQALSDDLLEEIRLLANIETNERKLLPLVLAGQPELATRLNTNHLRQLKQRVSLRCEIKPLDLSESAAYVASRIRAAGGEPFKLFSREAITAIHQAARGVPRTISVICDNCLLSGFALSQQPVTRDLVLEVCRDFDLGYGEGRPAMLDDTPAASEPSMLPPDTRSADVLQPQHAFIGQPGRAPSRELPLDAAKKTRFSLFGR